MSQHRTRRGTTLRVRLMLALLLLFGVGLAGFGLVTTSLYSRTLHAQLDAQLRSTVPIVSAQLSRSAGISSLFPGQSPGTGARSSNSTGFGTGGDHPPLVLASGTWGELRSATGAVLARVRVPTRIGRPSIPSPLPGTGVIVSASAATGSSGWRLTSIDGPAGSTIIVAVPTAATDSSLTRLIWIEILVGISLLAVLGGASYLIVARSLRPLESMATTASAIAEGDLSRRVEVATPASELDDLKRALNQMLDQIESSFADREATEQRLRQFLADASHELRTPLTSISGFAEVLGMEGGEEVDPALAARRIQAEAARMTRLVEDLLVLARMDESRALRSERVDLALVAADACSDAAAADRSRRITLTAEEPVIVIGDDDHLRQAAANLLANALRHTPSGTAIELTVVGDGQVARLAVRDHGPGIPIELLSKVFDRFVQVDPSRAGSGSGLGLSVVAAIATEHGGMARAENVAGGGCEVSLVIPQAT